MTGIAANRFVAEDLDAIVQRSKDDFHTMNGARILITGGTGFFGRWILSALHAACHQLHIELEVFVLSRNPEAFARAAPELVLSPMFKWLRGDIRDCTFPSGRFNYVIHAATSASDLLNRTQPFEMFDTIVSGTRRVIDFASQSECQSLLLVSSGAVYGKQPPTLPLMAETYTGTPDLTFPRSAYGEGKRAAEFLSMASGIPVKIARCFAFMGPFMAFNAHYAAGNFIRDACHHRSIEVRGDGTPLRSYLYAGDLVSWLLAILVRGKISTPYNVGSDQAISIAMLARLIAGQTGSEVMVRDTPGATPPERYVPSILRACDDLGLRVFTPLEQAVLRTCSWYQATH